MPIAAEYAMRILRHQPWSFVIALKGVDLTASDFTFQFRENKEAPDPAFLDLANAASPADGISATLEVVEGVQYTNVELRAEKATLEAITQPVPLGSDLPGFYGFKIDGVEYMNGSCTLAAQANHG